MITYIYQLILAVIIILVVLELFGEEKITLQMTAAMVLIPFILRLFMIG